MQEGYYKAAWNDVKNTDGWFKKMLLMGLVMLIPVFGPIVVYGYLFGWARDIAWGVQSPMPKSLFDNQDGKLYSRGFFVLVISFVCALLPMVIQFIGGLITGAGTFAFMPSSSGYYGSYSSSGYFAFAGLIGMVFGLVSFVAYFAALFFQWVGSMRMSVYGRLSAGFQFGKIWAMIRKDFNGLLRIFGMYLLFTAILSIVIGIVVSIVFFIIFAAAFAMAGGAVNMNSSYMDASTWGMIMSVMGISILFFIVLMYVAMVAGAFIESLVARALGYWTRQFDVPAWRGQDDPMPFELQAHAAAASGAAQPYAPAPVQPTAPAAPASPAAPVAQAAPVTPAAAPAVPVAEQPAYAPAPTPADTAPSILPEETAAATVEQAVAETAADVSVPVEPKLDVPANEDTTPPAPTV